MADSREIVDEMIARLRELQASDEYVPVGRKVSAGVGLAGGGPLTRDVSVSLDSASRAILEQVRTGKITGVPTTEEMKTAVAAAVEKAAVRVFYRDFSVMDSPLSKVTAPPLRVDGEWNIARINITVLNPGTKPVVANVGRLKVTANAGAESATLVSKLQRSAGDLLQVSVEATDAAGITVSLRVEESA